MTLRRSFLTGVLGASLALAACGGSDASTDDETDVPADVSNAAGIRLVSPEQAAATLANPPDDLVILDVRTQEEFDEGHIDGAIMIDFYRDDFAEQLAALDPDVPYVLYCRSGNRSGQASTMMSDIGFQSVEDVDGGILDWQQAGLPLTDG